MILIERTSPKHPQATALLHASHALMQSLFPPEDNFYLEIDDLCVVVVNDACHGIFNGANKL